MITYLGGKLGVLFAKIAREGEGTEMERRTYPGTDHFPGTGHLAQ
jgi:hypothetical protein